MEHVDELGYLLVGCLHVLLSFVVMLYLFVNCYDTLFILCYNILFVYYG